MRLVQRTAKSFERSPYGAYVAGEAWLYFALAPQLFGLSFWGSPSPADMASLVALLTRELRRPPHAALLDATALLEVRPESFARLVDYFAQHERTLARVVTETAVVLPGGMHRATIAGFFAVARRPFPVTWWNTVDEALERLGADDVTVASTAVNAATAARRSARDVVARSAEILGTLGVHASPTRLAESLGIPARSLQRQLAAANTSYTTLVQGVRIEHGKALLESSDDAIGAIASEAGFATSQHFSTVFRRIHGCTPTAYRKRFRALKGFSLRGEACLAEARPAR